jgi:membrane protein implicated in regulation of membrane protease activity
MNNILRFLVATVSIILSIVFLGILFIILSPLIILTGLLLYVLIIIGGIIFIVLSILSFIWYLARNENIIVRSKSYSIRQGKTLK